MSHRGVQKSNADEVIPIYRDHPEFWFTGTKDLIPLWSPFKKGDMNRPPLL